MPRYDVQEVKRRVDLVQLFSEAGLLHRRQGTVWTAACPDPAHEQTGASPPATVDDQQQLWRCHGCGAGGDAVTFWELRTGLGTGAAIQALAERSRLEPEPTAPPPTHKRADAHPRTRPSAHHSDLETYVAAAEQVLWEPAGADVLAWLRGRGLTDDALRAGRVGADPGPAALPRAAGLPSGPVGAVLPLLDGSGRPTYCQLRPIEPNQRGKYLNPTADAFGANPRIAALPTPEAAPSDLVVCEGLPDALTMIGAGYRAAAITGAGLPDSTVAERLLELAGDDRLVLAFDGDDAGRRGGDQLAELLHLAGAGRRVFRIEIPSWVAPDPKDRDLNTWAQAAGAAFAEQLAAADVVPAGWKPVLTAADVYVGFEAKLADPAGALAIPTSIGGLDELLAGGGWRPGLVLLGAMPGVGKTALALQSGLRAAGEGHPVVYVSVEQSEDELLGRIFTRETGHHIADWWNRDPLFLHGVRTTRPRLALENMYLRADPHIAGEDHQGTAGRIRAWVEEVVDVAGARPLVFVDYLQRMRPPEADRRLDERLRLSAAGLGLRQLARDLDVPVVVISSIGRGSYEGSPRLDWFKGSGDLEYDADACIILRPSETPVGDTPIPCELHLLKSRYGQLTGDRPLPLLFDRRHGSFRELYRATAGGPPRPPGMDSAA